MEYFVGFLVISLISGMILFVLPDFFRHHLFHKNERKLRLIYMLSFGKELNGTKKFGFQKVWQRFELNYSNYDAAEYECWFDICWEDQPEYLLKKL